MNIDNANSQLSIIGRSRCKPFVFMGSAVDDTVMATPQFHEWDNLGRPVTPSQTIREMVQRLRAAYPQAEFGWHADDAHYQADRPKDHTPYSKTEWPIPCPRYVVFATDVMPHPSYSLDDLHAYWLAEARAGRTPWRKYIIYRDKQYSVRSGWEERDFDGDYHNHIHLSDRTDYEFESLGSWDPVPGATQEVTMFTAQIDGNAACWISDGIKCRPVADYGTLLRYESLGVKHIVVPTDAELRSLIGDREFDGPDPVTLTPDQLALVQMAAAVGARAAVEKAMTPQAIADAIPDDAARDVAGLLVLRLRKR